jgi:hypothetical protein
MRLLNVLGADNGFTRDILLASNVIDVLEIFTLIDREYERTQ